MAQKVLDRTGQRFGMLVALREHGRDRQGRATWLCRCDCGVEKVVPSRHLGSGAVVSCGCFARSQAAESGRKGAAKITGTASPLYKQVVGYHAAHERIRVAKGPARNHHCVDCGQTAQHWSYNHADPDERRHQGLAYSLKPDHYEPRCVRCHSAHDRLDRIE